MTTAAPAISITKSKAFPTIPLAGLACGILDISAAIVSAQLRGGATPIRILQSVATGILGADAYKGGLKTAVLGLAIHFFIAFTAATVFYLASRKLKFMTQYPLVIGPLYGIIVFFFMRAVVFPLAGLPSITTLQASALVIGLFIHMLFVGSPISLVVSRYSK